MKAKHQRMRDPQISRLLHEAADWVEQAHEPVIDGPSYENQADVLQEVLDRHDVSLLPWQKKRLGL
jgi:hypothetical protein